MKRFFIAYIGFLLLSGVIFCAAGFDLGMLMMAGWGALTVGLGLLGAVIQKMVASPGKITRMSGREKQQWQCPRIVVIVGILLATALAGIFGSKELALTVFLTIANVIFGYSLGNIAGRSCRKFSLGFLAAVGGWISMLLWCFVANILNI